MFKQFLQDKAQLAGYELSSEQLEQFQKYFEELTEANKYLNLTNIIQQEEVALKHMIDSLTVYDARFFPANATVCDLGTGAGFPGVPLKIMHPALQVTLMDSLAKRLNFLQTLIDKLELTNISTCHMRAEIAGCQKEHREKYDVVTARAVAPLNVLAEYCIPLLKPGGIFAAMKGRQAHEEVASAEKALELLYGKVVEIKQVSLPTLPDERHIIYIKKTRHTAKTYPRQAGKPAKQPLC